MAYPVTRYASDLSDFADLVRVAANWKKQRAAIVEKDYYLTRALHSLRLAHEGKFILKGGTSLSKGWDLIDRFSEDLDILVRSESDWGAGKRDNRLRAMRDSIANTHGFEIDLNDKRSRSETGVSRTAVFSYQSVANDLPGLGKTVLIEAGYRGSFSATVKKPIQSTLSEYATAEGHSKFAEDLQSFEIELQDVRRTFVEKGFAIHAAYQKDRCVNRMRHYYDFSKLCALDAIKTYVGTSEYRGCVSDVKKISIESFPDQAVPEGDSLSKSPAFNVSDEAVALLEINYKREAEIFFSTPPSLKSILDEIGQLAPKL